MERVKELVADLREVVVLCNLTGKYQERGKITVEEAYAVLRKGMVKAEKILEALSKERTL